MICSRRRQTFVESFCGASKNYGLVTISHRNAGCFYWQFNRVFRPMALTLADACSCHPPSGRVEPRRGEGFFSIFKIDYR